MLVAGCGIASRRSSRSAASQQLACVACHHGVPLLQARLVCAHREMLRQNTCCRRLHGATAHIMCARHIASGVSQQHVPRSERERPNAHTRMAALVVCVHTKSLQVATNSETLQLLSHTLTHFWSQSKSDSSASRLLPVHPPCACEPAHHTDQTNAAHIDCSQALCLVNPDLRAWCVVVAALLDCGHVRETGRSVQAIERKQSRSRLR